MVDPVTVGAAVGWGMKAAGWVLSPIISKLLHKGFSYLSFDTSEKLKQLEIKVLQLELMLGLEAAEINPHRNRLEPLLRNLKSAFYEAEDILDDVEYHRLESQMLPHSCKQNWVHKIQSALPKCSCLKNQESGSMSYEALPNIIKKELKKSLEKIESIIDEAHKILPLLNLASHSNIEKRRTVAANSRSAVTTAAPPPIVFGRDKDRDNIVAMLHDTGADDQPKVHSAISYSIIGIHGISGSGKSTLAQLVCASEQKDKKEEMYGHFNIIMWVHVSQNFGVDTIFSAMLEEATGNPCPQFRSLNTLEQKLEEELSGKRFLLVLDDVWYNDGVSQQDLQKIVSPLKVADSGSKILVTSRTRDALLALGAVRCIPISDLDDNVFFELFMHYALEGAYIDEKDRRLFEAIGSDIAKKLRSSPLAARTVGGQLRIRPYVEFWRRVRDRDLLDQTMGALWWSYQHLDEQVRRCFAYCSIFPRRYRLERNELINLWVAEGFIHPTNAGQEMEDIAQDYLDELLSASFLQLVGENYYLVHDLLRDLAEKVARGDCFRIENGWTGEVPRDVRHLFVERCDRAFITNNILKLENLRTLMIRITTEGIGRDEFEMLTGLRKLRILRVSLRSWINHFSVPASIVQLKHMRYLAITTTLYVDLILPSTFSKLYHMQVLESGSGRWVFQDMSNFINLRHILSHTNQDLRNIFRLTSLQTLKNFSVKKEKGCELRQLAQLNKLRGIIWISGLENVESKEEGANLANKEQLRHVRLYWYGERCSPDVAAEVLEGLCPPVGLEKLEIFGYDGSTYPNWMLGKQSGPKDLLELSLLSCTRLGSAPELFEFFVHLRMLWLTECSWESLPDNVEHLTSLQKLVMILCLNIQLLPTLPQSLVNFEVDRCDGTFMMSCKTVGHPNWQKIEHIPNKRIVHL